MRASGKPTDMMDQQTYFEIFTKIYRAMVSEYHQVDAEDAVEADWEADGSDGGLSEAKFKGVMFELAQTWTPGSNPSKYVTFLTELLSAVTEVQVGDEVGSPRTFRPLLDIVPGAGQPSLFLAASHLDDLFDDEMGGPGMQEDWQYDAAASATGAAASASPGRRESWRKSNRWDLSRTSS